MTLTAALMWTSKTTVHYLETSAGLKTGQRKLDWTDSQADWRTGWNSLTNRVALNWYTGQCIPVREYLAHAENQWETSELETFNKKSVLLQKNTQCRSHSFPFIGLVH